MKLYFLLSICTTTYWLGECFHKRKRTEQDSTQYNEILAEYEKQHYNNYLIMENHNEWSQIERSMMAEICHIYLRKIFPKMNLSLKSHNIIKAVLRYSNIPATVLVMALACEISRLGDCRAYFHFIKAPHNDCLYLLNRRKNRSIKDFYIAMEVCGFHTFKDLKENGTLAEAIFKVKHNLKRNEIYISNVQRKHELNHLLDYSHNRDIYKTWPELEQKHPQEYCKYLLRKAFPRTHFEEINPEYKPLQLHYIRIKNEESHQHHEKNVAALFCFVKMGCKNLQNQYQFIRAPSSVNSMCAFLTSKIKRHLLNSFHITQLICEHEKSRTESYDTGILSDIADDIGTSTEQDEIGLLTSAQWLTPEIVDNLVKEEVSDTGRAS